MPTEIFEGTTLRLEASRVSGMPKAAPITFIYRRNGADVRTRVAVATEHTADIDFVAPRVADGETYYTLHGLAYWDNRELTFESWRVYPRDATVEAIDDGGKPCDRLRFRLAQDGVPGTEHRTRHGGTSSPIQVTKPAPFTVEPRPPWLISKHIVALGRKRKVQVVKMFEIQFLEPKGDGKQFVNLSTRDKGRDHQGTSISFELGVVGDQNKPADQRLGIAGAVAYVRVTHEVPNGVKARIRRSTSKPRLRSAGVQDFLETAKNDGRTRVFTGKVAFDPSDNRARFDVELGRHGGDRCKVEVGSTPACGDASMEFVNWRRLYYELAIPNTLQIATLPAATVQEMVRLGDSVYIEYHQDAAHSANVPLANSAVMLAPKSFFGVPGGGDFSVVTTLAPFDVLFTNAKSPRSVNVWIADVYAPMQGFEQSGQLRLSSPAGILTLPQNKAWLPFRLLRGNWAADIVPSAVPFQRATLKFNVTPNGASGSTLYVKLTNDRGTQTVLAFVVADGFHVTRSMREDIAQLLADASHEATLRANANVATIDIEVKDDEAKLIANVQKAIRDISEKVAMFGCKYHPGLDAQGQPRKGQLTLADVDLARSTTRTIAWNLPSGAGSVGELVGSRDDTKCPILIDVQFMSVNYNTVGGAKGSEPSMLFGLVDNSTYQPNPITTARIFVHEMGHKMGMSPYGAKDSQMGPGLPAAATVIQNEPRYPSNGSLGHVHEERGFRGEHCAYGLSDDQKGTTTYATVEHVKRSACIMFGSVGAADFCDQCVDYICALSLTDIRTKRS